MTVPPATGDGHDVGLNNKMEKHLQNLPIWCWTYLENHKNYPGIHFTAENTACDALLNCVEALKTLPDGSKRTIPLMPLKAIDEAKITGGQRFRALNKLRIVMHDASDNLRQMCISESDGVVTIQLVRTNTEPFEAGLHDVKKGMGDYSIAPQKSKKDGTVAGPQDERSLDLWFWPCFGHIRPEE